MSTSISGAAAEHLVTGQLLRRGLDAYLAHARTPGYDVIALRPETGKALRIQVKAGSGGRKDPWLYVKAKSRGQFDVLVYVDLSGERETYFIVPEAVIWPVHHVPPPGTTEHEGLQLRWIPEVEQYRDAWKHILSEGA